MEVQWNYYIFVTVYGSVVFQRSKEHLWVNNLCPLKKPVTIAVAIQKKLFSFTKTDKALTSQIIAENIQAMILKLLWQGNQ